MLLDYTKHIADLAHQIQLTYPTGFSNGLRPSRNTLIYVGATAAACVALGAAVKAIRRRSIDVDDSVIPKPEIKCLIGAKDQDQKPPRLWRRQEDELSDCESEFDVDITKAKLNTNVNDRFPSAAGIFGLN
ncbi:uncharacterized protein LOC124460570 [Drosophila willistoni]|uniref:uncharacterized protein LOC124460570 n=1 Tax=Drosophila willistoni TaxID=7260 RepID=UPI001F086B6D|nr:uncharacterized protein LOC124460570 [Drosophila willistoni]